MAASAQSLAKFSTNLHELMTEKSADNIIWSPYSIAIALSLLSQGARGATFEEIKKGLSFIGDQNAIAAEFNEWQTEVMECTEAEPLTFTVANKIYVERSHELKPEFKKLAEQKFNSDIESISFGDNVEAAAKINSWVENITKGKIKHIIASRDIDCLSRLVMINAVYFKGEWEYPFLAGNTREHPFWLTKEKWMVVNMMHQTSYFKYGNFNELDATALEMLYKPSDEQKPRCDWCGKEFSRKDVLKSHLKSCAVKRQKKKHVAPSSAPTPPTPPISFLILLPNKRSGLKDLEAKLNDVKLADLSNRMKRELVAVSLPKFRVDYEVDMKDLLQKLGISKIFNKNTADLGNILTDKDPQLHVSNMVHKAFIDVNERGTDACALTRMSLRGGALAVPKDFVGEHPFFYAIKSNGRYNLPLFCGALRSPSPIKNGKDH